MQNALPALAARALVCLASLWPFVLLLPAQDAPRSAADLTSEGIRLVLANQYDKAMSDFEAALKITREGGDVRGEAAALYGVGYLEQVRGNYDSARAALDRCLSLREQLGDSSDVGATLNSIGVLDTAKGLHAEALQFYQRALPLLEKAGNRSAVATVLTNIGGTFRILGDYQQALAYLERGLQDLQAPGQERARAGGLSRVAQVYAFLGDYSRALDYNAQVLALSEKLDNRELISGAWNLDGVIQNWRGNYRAALLSHEKALGIRREIEFRQGIAESLNNIGSVYQSQGDHLQAIEYFSQAIAMTLALKNQGLGSDAHRNRGAELLALGRASEAVNEFDQGYKLGEAAGEKVNVSISLAGLGRAYVRLGRSGEAIRSLERAIEIQVAIGDRRDLADTRAELANLQLQIGHTADALQTAREAAEIAASVERQDALWQAKLVAGRALETLSRTGEAVTELDGAIDVIESQYLHVAGPATAVPFYFADKLEPYRERMRLAISAGKPAQALELAERSRARALAEILGHGRTDVQKSLSKQEREQERQLENQLVSLNILVAQPSGSFERSPAETASLHSRLERKRSEWVSFRTALYAAHPELATARGVLPRLSPADMKRLSLETRALVLDYVVTPKATYLFVIQPSAEIRVVSIRVPAEDLKRTAGEFRRQLKSHDLSFAQASQEMFRLLLAPVADELRRYPALIIVPDGPLWDVPFQALQPRPKHYLIEDIAISYSPSLSVLRATLNSARERSSESPSLLALGDPTLSSADHLPEAARQVRELQRLYGGNRNRVLTGAAATEEAFKAEARNYRVLHLASHAVLDDASPMYSHVLLATNGTGSGREDGRLEARELMDLNLRAEMVVLAACETGRGGMTAGEGIVGMLWATFAAGAPTTVASLWRVESASTTELMIEFHRQWLRNRGARAPLAKAAALREAARRLIESGQYAHPFYWAGFILAGSPD